MNKVTLGSRPKNFKKVLQVALHDGELGLLEVSYIYRTRTEFGAFVDASIAQNDAASKLAKEAAKEAQPSSADEPFSVAKSMAGNVDQQADWLLKILDGWGLDAPFDRLHVRQLCDELPSVAARVVETYREVISEGRLGN